MKIIVINGSGGVGKDTFVSFAAKGDYKVYNFSCVDKIKKLALKIGWNGEKDNRGRRLLSDLKDALDKYDDVSFKSVIEQIKKIDKLDKALIFVHARQPEDIQRWVNETNAKTLLIRRAGVERYFNHADLNVYNYDYDYVYSNDKDIEQFEEEAIEFANWIGPKDWESHLPDE